MYIRNVKPDGKNMRYEVILENGNTLNMLAESDTGFIYSTDNHIKYADEKAAVELIRKEAKKKR